MEKITDYLIRPTFSEKGVVKAWKESVMLPTYEIGEEEKIRFFGKRVYQGSSGVVYPYPVVEKYQMKNMRKNIKLILLKMNISRL